ncbi:MAG: site-specific integrase [Mycobacterium sp.]|nr:site-specific integrase [Mycobacterium sp.]
MTTKRRTRQPGTFGTVETLPSGRYRVRYSGPDGRRHTAPTLFLTKQDARGWLALQQAEIIRNAWCPPEAQPKRAARITFAAWAEDWLRHRDVKPRTREHYRGILDSRLLPVFGHLPLGSISADDVRHWFAATGGNAPTYRAHAYALLRTIMGTAVSEGRIAANPCVIRGAGSTKRVHKIRPATLEEIGLIAAAMPEHQRAMVLLAAWCALRYGELTELRRKDLLITGGEQGPEGVVRIERAVVRTADGFQVTTPKSDAGIRDVAVPPHLIPLLQTHLDRYVEPGRESLLFPADHGGHLAPATLYRRFYPARAAAGRPDLRWHDLRHSGAVLAAATGATLAELMARLGHSTPTAAMRYQHAAQGRDKQIAALLSKLATG